MFSLQNAPYFHFSCGQLFGMFCLIRQVSKVSHTYYLIYSNFLYLATTMLLSSLIHHLPVSLASSASHVTAKFDKSIIDKMIIFVKYKNAFQLHNDLDSELNELELLYFKFETDF